jgi:hypothetical protein
VGAVKSFQLVEIGSGDRAVEAETGRVTNRGIQTGEHHVTAAEWREVCADFGPKLLKHTRAIDLRDLFG